MQLEMKTPLGCVSNNRIIIIDGGADRGRDGADWARDGERNKKGIRHHTARQAAAAAAAAAD